MFSSPDTFAYNLKQIGFNFLVNANNHSVDKGSKGLIRTLDNFDKAGISHAGVYRSLEERNSTYPYLLKIKGMKIAILNYSYGANGLPIPTGSFLNIIDTLQMASDLKAARDSTADAIVVCMHWGVEYQRLPNYEQKNISDFLFRNGADAIVGSHPHVIQPIEVRNFTYNNKPKQGIVIWSLGNFIANQRKRYADGGLMVKFDIAKNKYTGAVKIDNIYYLPFWVYKQLNPIKYRLLPITDFEKDTTVFKMNAEDQAAFKLFISDVKLHMATDTARIKMWLP
jgi:poly-gamma-glutamate capsule biosynthesis protein CapA/YwtB (metallophosphatase superfamily)